MSFSFTVNGKLANIDAAPDTPLLWVVREHLKLTGTKYGCGAGMCGACTVHLDGRAVRSCQTPIAAVTGKRVTTIEGLSANGDHPLQGGFAGAAMRLLPVRTDHAGGRAACKHEEPEPRRHHSSHGREYLSLRHLSTHPPRRRARR
jgi:2Fe-2S iron-sulfur cluster binding domain